MKRNLLFVLFIIFSCLPGNFFSQTYQLTGNPIVTTGWSTVSSATAIGDYIRLTEDWGGQYGAIKLDAPINLKYCDKWKVEFDFRIDGNGTSQFGRGDGFTFWYLKNPPTNYVAGAGLGIPANAEGLMVAFDIFNNTTERPMSQVHVLYGTNNVPYYNPNIEFNYTAGSAIHTGDFNINNAMPFVGSNYKHVEVNGQVSPANPDNWIITVKINGLTVVNGVTFRPSGGAIGMGEGYFGFSAATGGASARHSIKNAKIYINKVPILTNYVVHNACLNPSTGNGTVDLTFSQNQFVSNPANYTFSYFTSNGIEITNPENFEFTTSTLVSVVVKDNHGILCDNPDGKIFVNLTAVPAPAISSSSTMLCPNSSVTLTSSSATGNVWSTGETSQTITVSTPGTYNVSVRRGNCVSPSTSVTISSDTDPNVQISGNLLLCDSSNTTLTASSTGAGNTYLWSTGATTPSIVVSSAGTYTVSVSTPSHCSYTQSVTVEQGVVPVASNSTLSNCSNTSTSIFDLTSAESNMSTTGGVSFSYYVQESDALAGNNNTIATPTSYSSGNATIYVRIASSTCFKVVSLVLEVTQVVTPTISSSSTTLCPNSSVTLTSSSATGNVWSTGETSQTITVSAAGTYSLYVRNGDCSSLSTSVTISSDTDPNVQISGNLLLCDSSNTTLTASSTGAGNTYLWSTGATTPSIVVSSAGTYTVSVSTPSHCSYSESVTVEQGVVPVASNSTLSNCSNTSTSIFDLTSAESNMSTTGGVSFSYYVQESDALAGNNNTIATPTSYSSGNATIYVRIASSTCFKVVSLVLEVTQVVTPTISSSSTTLCPNSSVTLTSSSATGNVWSTGETSQTITVSAAGTYSLYVRNGDCSSLSTSVTISSDTDPNVQISGNLLLCDSSNTTLTASSTGAGNTYLWSTGATTPSIVVSSAGTYTVSVSTPSHCSYSESVTVEQGVVPVASNSTLSNCSNTSTSIFDLTSAESNMSTTGGVSFSYYVQESDALAGNNNTIATPTSYSSGNATIYVRIASSTCFKVVSLVLEVTQVVTPTISSSSTTLCPNSSVTLTSSSATGNVWSTGETSQTITVSAAGTYSLYVRNGDCSSLSTSVTISSDTDPNVQISGNLLLCDSSNTTLTASSTGAGNTYLWSTGATTPSIVVSSAGTYTVSVSTPSHCSYSESVTVEQGVVPVASNSTLSNCSNTSTSIFDLTSAESNMSTTGGVSFSYYVQESDALAGNNNTIATPTSYSSGNATIYVRIASSTCFKVVSLVLEVTQVVTPTISSSSTTLCPNSSVTLTSSSATGNVWSTGETSQTITVSAAGTYSLYVRNGDCSSLSTSVTISSDTDPNVQISGNLLLCDSSNTTLTASSTGAGNTYLWSTGATTPSIVVSSAGTYTVSVSTPSHCSYTQSVTVTVVPPIIVNISNPEKLNCITSQITLNGTASVYQPGATFLWTATGGGNIVSGANTLTPVVNNSGIYTLTITSAFPNNCVKQKSVTVIKDTTKPVINVSASRLVICKGESVVLTSTGGVTYTWAGLEGSENTQTVSPESTTTYTVTGVGANGCSAENPATVTIRVVPEIESTLQNIEICKGDKGILDAGSDLSYSYVWNTGETSQTISVEAEGTYSVTISNGVCSKTFSATVTYIASPQIKEIIYNNNLLTIVAQNQGSIPLEYSNDGGVTWQAHHVFNVLRNTKYSIRVRNKRTNCDAFVEYYTFFLPNVITPNDDGKNDVIDFSEISKLGNFEGRIFDRYGQEVFKPTTKDPIWKGKYIGRPLPTGTYWYQLQWEDRITKNPIQISGWILLKNRD